VPLTASYSGDNNFSPSTATVIVTIPSMGAVCAYLLALWVGPPGPPGHYEEIANPAKALATAEQELAVLVTEGRGDTYAANALRALIQRLKVAILIGCT
jgi:hypothetical protein